MARGLGDPWEEYRAAARRRRRHGEQKPVQSSLRAVARAGRRAARRGIERWANPHTDRLARAWRWGWEHAHGACAGCEACVAGCTPPTVALFVAIETPRSLDVVGRPLRGGAA